MESKTYHYILRGKVREKDEVLYLELPDQTLFKIKQIPINYPTEKTSWFVSPNTTAEGKIMSLNLEEISDEPTESAMTMIGRVTVLGKKMAFVQLKVSRPPLKTLRISVHPAHQDMKQGQIWAVKAVRQGDLFMMKQGKIIEKDGG